MSQAWNSRFASWAQPPSATETEKIQHAITAVRDSLAAAGNLSSCTKAFIQGSYRNRVNVRLDSDIDIGVLYTGNSFGANYPQGKRRDDFGNAAADYSYADFKNDIENALVAFFGRTSVTRGKKAFDIHANTYRVDADVVPLFVHRRYADNGDYICGVQLIEDGAGRIINWPEKLYDDLHWPNQHYENGNNKNQESGRSYRGVVRIIKKLRNVMADDGIQEALPVKGFQIECLVWNAPNSCFTNPTWFEDVRAVLTHLSVYLATLALCGEWGEVSEFKYLVKGDDAKRAQLEAFVDRARAYIGVG